MPTFTVHPPLKRDDHFVIEFNEPMKGNENAFGLDLASMPSQLEAVLAARDSGEIAATGRTLLVQDATRHPGFIARAPIYRQNMPLDSVEQRRAAFIGVVAIVFRVEDLMREGGSVNLSVRMSPEPEGGLVLTFDDMTKLISAQRQEAWKDVARRIGGTRRAGMGSRPTP